MYIPTSTYRIQFNKGFTFKNLEKRLNYLTSLGIGAIYASPVFEAVPGSNHGYDVTNPQAFNKEIGTEAEFGNISNFLKSKNIGWIQDIVPNHMAFHPHNAWLMDVLEKGKQSAYSGYFDIDWNHPVYTNKVMVPILGKTQEQAVNDGEIKLEWENGGFFICYYDFRIPASGESFHELLEEFKVLEDSYFVGQGIASEEFKSDPAFKGFGWSNSRERFQAIYNTDNSFETLVDNICSEINSNSEKLKDLLAKQHFVLTYWQEVDNALNYRRFFTINGLISLCMEKHKVFEDYHSFIHKQVENARFQGLRIDHIDGLLCPNMYFERLRAKMGEETYIVVEKILERQEILHKDWPLQGTSGYDFLAIVNNIFTYQPSYHKLTSFYKEMAHIESDPEEIIYQKKKQILEESFRGDWENICRKIEESGLIDYNNEITPNNLKEAIGEFIINCPVYKLYSSGSPPETDDIDIIQQITGKSTQRTPALKAPLNKLKDVILGNANHTSEQKEATLSFFQKCMQYTGPLMAKGVEDTAMYTWGAFIAHNEVGDAIDADGISITDFHHRIAERQIHYPHSINATATHDTKRGEDSRARLNVISNFAEDWIKLVRRWMIENQPLKSLINNNPAPDLNEEYFIYQTLLGAMPMNGIPDQELNDRLAEYIRKALREAKINSNWNNPDEDYEAAVIHFTTKLLAPGSSFMNTFLPFFEKVVPWGIINSLSQLVLKCTVPGIPDFYQGTELWDLSLVDPDNRRQVDYDNREWLLNQLKERELQDNFPDELITSKKDGKIKLWLTYKLLHERKLFPEVFNHGEYLPLNTTGDYSEHILAFARKHKSNWYMTVIPLHGAALPAGENQFINWGNTSIEMPASAPENWTFLWDGSKLKSSKSWPVSNILTHNIPVVLKGKNKETNRGSGILMHLTSVPGKYGTGDFGKEAYRFVDFLKKAGQSYWQILPFNPVGGSFSPYSSSSAFAGNIIFIDPDDLLTQRLINHLPETLHDSNEADFRKALTIKETAIDEAFENYVKKNSPLLQKRFELFCQQQKHWLEDYALFTILKQKYNNEPWNKWPEEFKTRNKENLTAFAEINAPALTRVKFGQYLFDIQFKKLKKHANSAGINIIGDIPIYVSYDSADVWASPQIFNLGQDLEMITVAGVPPDYFSETGQLWNMPVYNWQTMEEDGFRWWKTRISRNLEFCDKLRFDHFRGFSSYWEVPAGESTAINGSWIKGPGDRFFTELRKSFPEMPFIAEDLGDIDEDVYNLRDTFALPGMRVLQFAFGDDMPGSVHIPHNHSQNSIVYTGTHDNNTIKGWYSKEVNRAMKSQLKTYFNRNVNTQKISDEFIRLAFGSVAQIAIIPIQDWLNLDEKARFNTPSKPEGNWKWKLTAKDTIPADELKKLTILYGRVNY